MAPERRTKQLLAATLDRAGLLAADLRLRGSSAVIAVNYHSTPPTFAARLQEQLAFFSECFECLGEDDLLTFLSGRRLLRKPGLVLCFDDGHEDHYEVAGPLLERFGLRGWFMLVGGFLDQPRDTQSAYFQKHIRPNPEFGSARAMTWEQARSLVSRGHWMGCHTWSHRTLGDASPIMIEDEVAQSRTRLGEALRSQVRTFCWPRGRVLDHSHAAHRVVRRVYDLAFTSMGKAIRQGDDSRRLYRFNIEASFSLAHVRFQISRLNEMLFSARRKATARRLEGY